MIMFSLQLAKEGLKIVLISRSQSKLDSVAAEIGMLADYLHKLGPPLKYVNRKKKWPI